MSWAIVVRSTIKAKDNRVIKLDPIFIRVYYLVANFYSVAVATPLFKIFLI